ncbi:carbon-nitrogen hydrolase family protein [Flavitalea sp. BT771]|uniref:carbon-nitrogen hydrolase family protein n=1 Tax=Flavitalea sp. BT771 TaxID=3063329 RepID=UPI0026E3C4E5|nr:carbon-nitrogen hydrolase family protein [Flavitalea sp. BT771]MDO6431124.1 carbon-nitrogen hydrolase family protein [Flavitalea sp. BT771]MDV6220031.1 carbon-nitrogen hydrolase family protein [Flavitalea sp. BT771]
MKIAVASPPFPGSVNDGLYWLEKLVKEASAQQADIICFPESYLPGYPGMGYTPEDRTEENLRSALDKVCRIAAENSIAIIIPMDWHHADGLLNVAHVVSGTGEILGYQTKNQLDPTEDHFWTAGTTRHIFEVKGVKFGITICHEGFRYPESVRWAAQHDARIVFHPHFVGSNTEGLSLTEWGSKENPYYEKAMMMRALENTIFFASSNYASRYPDSASSIIAPDGTCIAHVAYGEPGIAVADIDIALATGLLAKRFKNELYGVPSKSSIS